MFWASQSLTDGHTAFKSLRSKRGSSASWTEHSQSTTSPPEARKWKRRKGRGRSHGIPFKGTLPTAGRVPSRPQLLKFHQLQEQGLTFKTRTPGEQSRFKLWHQTEEMLLSYICWFLSLWTTRRINYCIMTKWWRTATELLGDVRFGQGKVGIQAPIQSGTGPAWRLGELTQAETECVRKEAGERMAEVGWGLERRLPCVRGGQLLNARKWKSDLLRTLWRERALHFAVYPLKGQMSPDTWSKSFWSRWELQMYLWSFLYSRRVWAGSQGMVWGSGPSLWFFS